MEKKLKIYVASSWRNNYQPEVVEALKEAGQIPYDFRHPSDDSEGFRWSEIDNGYESWDLAQYLAALDHPIAVKGYAADFEAMQSADVFILVNPCGRSAHLEAGWAVGANKPLIIYCPPGAEVVPELMYKMATAVVGSKSALLLALLALD